VSETRLLRQIVAEEVEAAAGNREVVSTGSLRYTLNRGRNQGAYPDLLETRCFGRLLPATVRLKLHGFKEQWHAHRVAAPPADPTGAEAAHLVYQVRLPAGLLQRWLGQQPGLEVRIQMRVPATTTESLTEVAVQVQPLACNPQKGAELLAEVGPRILESLRNYLQLHTERRSEERFPYSTAVQVLPILPTQEAAAPFVARGKDISTRGLGLYLPCQPPSPYVHLQFAPGQRPPVAVPARIVRAQPLADGRVEVGLCFAWEGF
jgi:hypothetical protein